MLAESIAREIEGFLDTPLRLLQQAQISYTKSKAVPKKYADEFIDNILQNNNIFEAIIILDSDGIARSLSPYDENLIGVDFSYQKYYIQQKKTNQPQWSPTFISSKSGNTTLTLTVPFDDGMVVGLLDLDYLKIISEKVRLGAMGYVIICDSDGTIIAHIDQRTVKERLNVNNYKIIQDGMKSISGTYQYHYKGADKIGSLAIVPQTGWLVIINQPIEEAFAPVYRIQFIFWCAVLTAVFFAILVSLISQRITLHPLTKLTDDTKRIASGQSSLSLQPPTYTEMAILEDSFIKMLDTLKYRENALKESEEKLQITLNSIGEAVISTDIEGRIEMMNPVAEGLTGSNAQDSIGLFFVNVIKLINQSTQHEITGLIETVIERNNVIALSDGCVMIDKTGREHIVASSGSPIYDAQGRVVGVVLVFRDITEHAVMEDKIRQAEKMKSIGQLAGGIAHDFNNMLGGIIGACELLQINLPDNAKAEKYTSIILESALRATSLASKLLAFSRRQMVEEIPVDIHNIILEAVSLLENTIDKRIKIDIDLSAKSSIVVGDHAQLQNVFLNLGINSWHAMPDGGILTLQTKLANLTEAYCNASTFNLQPGEYIEIEVRDNGCGISPKDIQHIFEPFFTTKEQGKGTGLGLAAAYGTVQQHKGSITVYSEVGKGTCFHLLLPIAKETSPIIKDKNIPIRGEGLILLVDDESVMRETGKALLEELGYEVLLAENGSLAMETFKNSVKKVDLVILDMIMPEMNGRDCFHALKEIRDDIPVILASGFTRNEDLADLRKQGLSGFIQKPFRSTELSRIVSEAIQKRK